MPPSPCPKCMPEVYGYMAELAFFMIYQHHHCMLLVLKALHVSHAWLSIHACIPLPLNITALSVARVRSILQGLDWRTIGREVMDIPDNKLEELIQGVTTGEKREEILIDYWFLRHPLLSWRLLTARLDNMGNHDQADRIRHLAEELTGKCSVLSHQCVVT